MKLHLGVFFYRQETFVKQFFEDISSLIKLSEKKVELQISIFDDGSPDGTQREISAHAFGIPFQFNLYLSPVNQGLKARLCQFVQLVQTSEVVMMIGGDDRINIQGILEGVTLFDGEELELLVCNSSGGGEKPNSLAHHNRWPYTNLNKSREAVYAFLTTYYPRPLLIQATLFKASLLKRIKAFSWKARLDDWPLFLEIFSIDAKYKFKPNLIISQYIPNPLSTSSSQERLLNLVEEVAIERGLTSRWGPRSIIDFRRRVVELRKDKMKISSYLNLLSAGAIIGFFMEVNYKWRSMFQH